MKRSILIHKTVAIIQSREYLYVMSICFIFLAILSSILLLQPFNSTTHISNTRAFTDSVDLGSNQTIVEENSVGIEVDEEEIVPEDPTLISPNTGSDYMSGLPITFSWDTAVGAERYYLEITGGALEYPYMTPGWIADTSFTYTNMLDMSSNPYYWRVKAGNYFGESGWSETRSLTVSQRYPNPSAPQLSFPANNSSFIQGEVINFSWQPTNFAAEYQLEVSGGDLLEPLLNTGWIKETSYTYSNIIPVSSNPYVWKVMARNAVGSSTWSIRSFYIKPIPTGCAVPSSNGVILYTDFNCTGTRFISGLTSYTKLISPYNNSIKSIYIKNGWSIKIFENKDKSGGRLCITSSQNSLKGLKYNNGSLVIKNGKSTITAIKVTQSTDCR